MQKMEFSPTALLSSLNARGRIVKPAIWAFVLILITFTLTLDIPIHDGNIFSSPSSSKLENDLSQSGLHGNVTFPFIANNPRVVNHDGRNFIHPAYGRPGWDAPLASGLPLRIMCIGASTTLGDGHGESWPNWGFRKTLRAQLVGIGNPVNFVGSQRKGAMPDNDIEAYPGNRVDELTHRVQENGVIAATRPNLVIVNAGANDGYQHFDIDNFYRRLYEMATYLYEHASPGATLVLGTVLPTTETERFNAAQEVPKLNRQIRLVQKMLERENRSVVLAEMNGMQGLQEGNLGKDGMHPDLAGYEMMSGILLRAIIEADAKGFLHEADDVAGISDDGNEGRMTPAYIQQVNEEAARQAMNEQMEEKEILEMMAQIEKDKKMATV